MHMYIDVLDIFVADMVFLGSRGVLGRSRGIVFGAPGVAGSSPGLTYNFSNCYTSLFRDHFVAFFGFLVRLRAHTGVDLWNRSVQIMAVSCVLMFSGFQLAIFPTFFRSRGFLVGCLRFPAHCLTLFVLDLSG